MEQHYCNRNMLIRKENITDNEVYSKHKMLHLLCRNDCVDWPAEMRHWSIRPIRHAQYGKLHPRGPGNSEKYHLLSRDYLGVKDLPGSWFRPWTLWWWKYSEFLQRFLILGKSSCGGGHSYCLRYLLIGGTCKFTPVACSQLVMLTNTTDRRLDCATSAVLLLGGAEAAVDHPALMNRSPLHTTVTSCNPRREGLFLSPESL